MACPRVELSPTFLQAFLTSKTIGRSWGIVGGWPDYAALSASLKGEMPAGEVTLKRFYRVADAMKFPRSQVFRWVAR